MEPVLNVGLPVFAIILTGYLAGRFGILGGASTEALNAFVYYFALPPLLFLSMARVPLEDVFNWHFLAAYSGGVLGTYVLSMLAGLMIFRNRPAALSLQGMTAIFTNTGYMGVPLYLIAFGEQGALPAIILTVYNGAIVVGLTIVLIELDLRSGSEPIKILGDVALAIVTNPLIISAAAGMVLSLLGVTLPRSVVNFCTILGNASGPCALFAMGLFLAGRQMAARRSEIAWLTLLKLAVQPAITWWLAFHVLRLEPFWAASAVVMAALPTGATAFVIAQRYGAYVGEATAVTLITTVLSFFTVSALLVWFGMG
ncbi:MAG: AEC family transporter [Alphaproteobacteria bacterium]|nr:AEC family transporter [Alphaproteobacteria bacterium]